MAFAPRALSILALGAFVAACAGPTSPSESTAPVATQASATAGLSVPLTAGTLQFYSGDPGSAHLIANGFEVTSMASGNWPIAVRPSSPVNFSTEVVLSNWGQAVVSGIPLRGDPTAPGGGRVWIRGNLQVTAVPFLAPPLSVFGDGLQAAVTVSGSVAGFFNDEPGQPALFNVNVFGGGTASGAYRLAATGADPMYVDNCCALVAINVSAH